MGNDNIKVSVRELVEFVLRKGDLVSEFKGSSRNVDAIKIHKKLEQSDECEYMKEVALSYCITSNNVTIQISGRADGIIINDKEITIDEIKTTTTPLDKVDENYNILHWAQAKCYAFIYCIQNNLKEINVQITYYEFDSKDVKRIIKKFYFDELKNFFEDLINKFLEYANLISNWKRVRNISIEKINFPFSDYRKGQRKFAVSTYVSIKRGKRAFIEAPTGIGKTIASIFPSIKALYEGHCSKIFYITPKTTQKVNAQNVFLKMKSLGLRFKVIIITSKEKICFNDKNCDPEVCKYAKGHYDRINEAIKDIFSNEDIFSQEIIKKYSKKHSVCPFEFSLDLCNYADCVICDYNYVFDPRAYLRRFFDVKNDYVVLIDEAHNLVDRAREMYSSQLNKEDFLNIRRCVKNDIPKLYKILNKINTYFLSQKKNIEGNFLIQKQIPNELLPLLRRFITCTDNWLSKEEKADFNEELLELYFDVLSFLRICESYDGKYITYVQKENKNIKIKLFCIDPSTMLENTLKKIKSVIYFSATLTPMNYYVSLLGCTKDVIKIKLQSPFPKENLLTVIDNRISTKYNNRDLTCSEVVNDIRNVISGRKGNYLVYFPSYEYMNKVFENFRTQYPNINIVKQNIGMSEDERSEFLNKFYNDNSNMLVGFAVMGGIFSEGIDLVGNKLIGVIIVGVGIPKVCVERNIIKQYFDKIYKKGFEYSYIYPGINKVMQAAGRVIRTKEDKGIIFLIDDRFTKKNYLSLLPKYWFPINLYKNSNEFNDIINKFWNKDNE